MEVDLNSDLGEGCSFDSELMPLITSANIACGAHAGDAGTMTAALEAARLHGVQVGAHPGFFDRDFFGRREIDITPEQVISDCCRQIETLLKLASDLQVEVRYLKPHGALYNMACRERPLAAAVVQVSKQMGLALMGLPESVLESEARASGCRFIREGFADRRYLPDGSLVPRSQPDAFVHDSGEAARQAEWLIQARNVESICVHGDNPEAVAFVRRLREHLQSRGYAIEAFDCASPSLRSV